MILILLMVNMSVLCTPCTLLLDAVHAQYFMLGSHTPPRPFVNTDGDTGQLNLNYSALVSDRSAWSSIMTVENQLDTYERTDRLLVCSGTAL
jgi:hypothetical protein